MMKIFEGDGADRAGVIGLIRQGFAGVGLEADQPDRDRVSSDQGFLIGRSGHDRSDQGQLRVRPGVPNKKPSTFLHEVWPNSRPPTISMLDMKEGQTRGR